MLILGFFRYNMMKAEPKVQQRYAAAPHGPGAAFCCRAGCDCRYLKVVQDQVIDKDYGCAGPYCGDGECC